MEAKVLADLGLAGVIAVFVIKELLRHIKNGRSKVDTVKQYDMVKDLHKWHDKEDSDGVKIWYSNSTSRVIEHMETEITALRNEVKALREKLK